MPSKTQRKGSNSPERHVEMYRVADMEIDIPPGFESDSDEFRYLWHMFISSRPRLEWLPGDLIVLARYCEAECELREQRRLMKEEGLLLDGGHQGPKGNPRVRYINLLLTEMDKLRKAINLHPSSTHVSQGRAALDEHRVRDEKQKRGKSLLIAA